MKQDKVSDVVDIEFLGFETEMFEADGCSSLIE